MSAINRDARDHRVPFHYEPHTYGLGYEALDARPCLGQGRFSPADSFM